MKKEENGQIGDIQLRDYELKIDSNSYSLLEVFMGRMPFDGQDCPAVISWNYLMPVVEKISKYCYEEFKTNNGYKDVTEYDYAYPRTFAMLNNSGKFMIRINRMCLHEDEILIKATYEAINVVV